MKLVLGDAVIVKAMAHFNGSDEHPAIVTRVWGTDDTRNGPQCVNVMVLPDCGAPFCMTSVAVYDERPDGAGVGQGWLPRPGR